MKHVGGEERPITIIFNVLTHLVATRVAELFVSQFEASGLVLYR